MTDGKDLKRLVRQRMAKTGESYTTALAHFRPKGQERSPIDDLRDAIYTRTGIDELGSHLEARYGIEVAKLTELDVGVYRVARHDGPAWVARVFPARRPLRETELDADVLRHVAHHGVPAERCAHHEPVSMLDGQAVLVTELLVGTNGRSETTAAALQRLGDLLGRVHALPAMAATRDAGSWHLLAMEGGGSRADVDALLPLLEATGASADVAPLVERLRAIDHCDDLPHLLTHPDPVGANAIVSPYGEPALIDWTGAGHGARLLAFAALVSGSLQPQPSPRFSSELDRVDAVVDGYRTHAAPLTDAELTRLPAALVRGTIVLGAWMFLFQDLPIDELLAWIADADRMAGPTAARVEEAFDREIEEPPATVHPGQGTLL